MIQTMLHGLSMALADSVPGVSGGTIAFIMGFYEQFLGSLHALFGRDKGARKQALAYLIKFAVGWCVGMGASVLLLSNVFDRHVYVLSSLFLGLTVAALPFIAYAEQSALKGPRWHLLFTLLGASLVVAMTALRGQSALLGNLEFSALQPLQYGYLVLSGLLAISAMLLPGVSGSTLLLIFGIYMPAINAVKGVLSLQFAYLPGLIAIATGAVLGIVFISGFIQTALHKWRSQMIYLILGLMLGSLYAIVMGPTTLSPSQPPLDLSTFHIIAFIIGVAIPCTLEYSKHHAKANRPRG